MSSAPMLLAKAYCHWWTSQPRLPSTGQRSKGLCNLQWILPQLITTKTGTKGHFVAASVLMLTIRSTNRRIIPLTIPPQDHRRSWIPPPHSHTVVPAQSLTLRRRESWTRSVDTQTSHKGFGPSITVTHEYTHDGVTYSTTSSWIWVWNT